MMEPSHVLKARVQSFNTSPPKFIDPFPGKVNLNLLSSQPCYKYASYEHAYATSTPVIQDVLDHMFKQFEPVDVMRFRHCATDIKLKFLRKGQYPCIPGWHTDCTLDMNHHTKGEMHILFQTGAKCYTEFITCPVESSIDFITRFDDNPSFSFNRSRARSFDNACVSYGRTNLHRCTRAEQDGWRLLIRLSLTDLIRPNNRPIK